MKLNLTLAASALILMTVGTMSVAKDNGPCKPGNASFCGVQGPAGPQGPQGATGPAGPQGPAGQDGLVALQIIEVPSPELERLRKTTQSYIAATGAMASLQTRTPTEGQWTGALGISGTDYGADGVAGAVRYGISDTSDIYISVGHSRFGGTVWGVGASFVLGGGK